MDISEVIAAPIEAGSIRISRESYVLGLICIADMVSTILLVRSGRAIEANPILAPFMERGIGVFFLAKSLLFVIPLFALELLRSKRPLFVKKMLRVGIAAYLISYGVGVLKVNQMPTGATTEIASRPVSQ